MKTARRSPCDARIVQMTATAARTSGDGVVIAGGVGMQQDTTANGAVGVVWIGGQHAVDKVSAQAWAEGVKIYLDTAAALFTTVAGGNTLAGFATKVAANPSSKGEVYIFEPPGV